MIRKDYLLRQISEMIRFLINLLLYPERKQEQTGSITLAYSVLGLKNEEIPEGDATQLIEKYQEEELFIEKLELLALILLQEADQSEDEQEKASLRLKGVVLLEYVQKNSAVFSMERSRILNEQNR